MTHRICQKERHPQQKVQNQHESPGFRKIT